MMARRDSPEPPGPSCISKNTLVASTTSSRRVYLFTARPTISSELPKLYTLAVSQNVMPSSTACRNKGSAASSPSDHSLKPREVSPKLMQPSAMRLTFRPALPRWVYSMVGLLPLDGLVQSVRPGPATDDAPPHY